MKKLARTVIAAALVFAAISCDQSFKTELQTKGTVSFQEFNITTELQPEVIVKSLIKAPEDYNIAITDPDGEVVFKSTYSEVKKTGYGVELTAGNYILKAYSGIPSEAEFDAPEYGVAQSFTVKAGETTKLASVVCKVMQAAIKISYDKELLAEMTGDGSASVEVMSGFPLEYKLQYNSGKPVYDTRTGYFSVSDGSNSLIITFTGKVSGSNQKMTKMYSGIQGGQLFEIVFSKKLSPEGTATIDIITNGYIEDKEVSSLVEVPMLQVIGEDPDAPKGDGGIKLEFAPGCTMYTDFSSIVVPKMDEGVMDLRLLATIPNGAKKLNVHIESTSETFMAAIQAAGGSELDLINPSPESEVIFQVVPFPHGPELIGAESIYFDLCAAQEPILEYVGRHSFTINITDAKGCRKSQTVVLIVKE